MTAVPYDLQHRAVDSLCLKARASEEVHAIKLEMYGLLSYYDNLNINLRFQLTELTGGSDLQRKYVTLFQTIVHIELQHLTLADAVQHLKDELLVDTAFLDVALYSPQESHLDHDDIHLQLELSDDEDICVEDEDDVPTDDEYDPVQYSHL